MAKKRFGAEQIVTLLRQIEVSMAQGKPTPVACWDAGISQQSSGTSCSMERSSTRYAKHRLSLRVGGVITTLSDRTPRSATNHRHRRCLCQHLPRGRLR